MAARPNKMGRIEAEPKVKKPLPWKNIGIIVAGLALFAAGVSGTLGYQNFINGVKQEGVAEFKAIQCEKFTDKAKNISWLECNE